MGYEGISWTKSRVRRYKLDEVQEEKWRNKLDKVQIKKRKKKRKKKKRRRNKLDEVQRGEWSKTGIIIA